MGFERICVVGLGYIGLPTAAVFASRGISVLGVDVAQHVVDTINRGEIHIIEPDLDAVVHHVVRVGRLRAATAPEPADAFLIAVPTPFTGTGHQPDLRYVESAARSIAPVLKKGDLVVLESTSPVGATEQMARWLREERLDLAVPLATGDDADIYVAHCPERVLPGHVLRELIENDRVIGGITPACSERAAALYKTFVEGECVLTTARTAEMAKLSENSFRDVNIAFANELSLVCAKQGIDVWELIALANRHPRVNILAPGPGVGGHCIAVDPWFIVAGSPNEAKLIRTAREVNDGKPGWVVEQVNGAVEAAARRKGIIVTAVRILCYGLAFKADIDDLRESPAIAIVQRLAAQYPGQVSVIEPNIAALPNGLDGVTLVGTCERDADVHVMLVDHTPFRDGSVPEGEVVDTRGVWRKA